MQETPTAGTGVRLAAADGISAKCPKVDAEAVCVLDLLVHHAGKVAVDIHCSVV